MTRTDRRGGATPSRGASQEPGPAGTTLEAFVAQLHREGVEAGRREAERLVRAAEEAAEEVLRTACGEADALVTDARARASREEARARAELQLVIRDAVLQLQATLTDVLRSLLTRAIEARLSDPDLLATLLKEVVGAYARADAESRPMEVRVPREMAEALEQWWLRELGSLSTNGPPPRLLATLEEAGFRYTVAGGTVELSTDAAAEILMELVRPGLRDLVAGAVPRGEPWAAKPTSP